MKRKNREKQEKKRNRIIMARMTKRVKSNKWMEQMRKIFVAKGSKWMRMRGKERDINRE